MKVEIKKVLGFCMEAVRACDEKADAEGFCQCSRYIGMWLAMFERNGKGGAMSREMERLLTAAKNMGEEVYRETADYGGCYLDHEDLAELIAAARQYREATDTTPRQDRDWPNENPDDIPDDWPMANEIQMPVRGDK